jgi:GNAT superfamily N-acetyltransferase
VSRTQPHIATRAEIRPAGPADQDAIVTFLNGLSTPTRYLRFFAGFSPTSPAMLRILTGASGDVLIALVGGEVVGHAMAAYAPADVPADGPADGPAPDDPRPVAHLGVVVADAWQGRGVGSALMSALSAAVRAHGASALVMDVLRENTKVIAMIAEHWPGARYDQDAECVMISAPADAPVSPYRAAADQTPARPAPPGADPGELTGWADDRARGRAGGDDRGRRVAGGGLPGRAPAGPQPALR